MLPKRAYDLGVGMGNDNQDARYRLSHTMLRVKDLDKTLDFYCRLMGMRVLRRTDYEGGRFTNTFIGYGEENTHTTIELTHNWDTDQYDMGEALATPLTDLRLFGKSEIRGHRRLGVALARGETLQAARETAVQVAGAIGIELQN